MKHRLVIEFDPATFQAAAERMGDGMLAQQLVNIFMFTSDEHAARDLRASLGIDVMEFGPLEPQPERGPALG